MSTPDRRLLLSLWSLYVIFSAALLVEDGVAQTIFLQRVGVASLPMMFGVKAALDLVAALLYLPIARYLGNRRTMVAVLLFGTVGTLGAWLLLRTGDAAAYIALFAFNELLQTVIKIHWGVFLLDFYSSGVVEQRRLTVVYTGARVGAMLGGLMLGLLATSLGVANLLVGCGALLILAALLVRTSPKTDDPVASGGFGPLSEIGKGLQVALHSPLLRAIAASTSAMVICRFALRLRYSELFTSLLGEVQLARYYGLYAAAANPIAALLSLLVTTRLLDAIGLTGTNVVYALALPASVVAMRLRPGVPAAVIARLVENELKVAIKTPLSNLFYGALDQARRPAARALIFGAVVPAATISAALLLQRPELIDYWLLPLALVFLVTSLLQNRAFAVALALAFTLATTAPAEAKQPADKSACQLSVSASGWHERAMAGTNRELLGRVFGRQGYRVPDNSYLLAARVQRGVKQLSFQYFSLGDSAFTYSAPDNYWPASTVKLMAAVGALWTLRKYGLDGRAVVELTDVDGSYRGTIRQLIDRALGRSTNVDYNRLVLIAGYDTLNAEVLTMRHGMPTMVLQRRYGKKLPGIDRELRHSPEIHYRQGNKRGVIAARSGKLQHPGCPEKGNCANLFELQEGLRRVTLQHEIPPSERFPINRGDWRRIMKALLKAKNKFGDGATRALGHPVEIYNKAGRVPGDDHLENALVIDTVTKRRYLVAMSVPYASMREPDKISFDKLVEMGRRTLTFLASRRGRRWPALQLDAGTDIEVTPLPLPDSPRSFEIVVGALRATRLSAWLDGKRLRLKRAGSAGKRKWTHRRAFDSRKQLLVVKAYRGRRAIGYRAAVLQCLAAK